MPFGLSTAPATFQRMMNTIFFEMLDLGVLVYLEDVLIYSKTVEEHIILLDKAFALLQKRKLYLKEKKGSLFLEKINYFFKICLCHNYVITFINKKPLEFRI